MNEEPLTPASPTPAADSASGDSPADRGARRRLPPEARRQQILEAALACFSDKGFHASTMDDLVRVSGLSKGSLYWHFKSKEEVLLALVDAFSAELYDAWDEVAESSVDKLEVLKREYETSVQRFASERRFLLAWAEFIAHPAARERMRESYEIARRKFEAIVEAGRANGTLADGPPADRVAATLVGTLEGVFVQWLVDPDFDLERHAQVAWQLTERGIRP